MNDRELQAWVERVSLEFFRLPFRHKATFNSRLRTTGGRYFTKSHNIEISRKHFDAHGVEEMEKIVKHELCHYHLHINRGGYRHMDADFKQLLKLVGGARYCKPLPEGRRREPYRYRLACVNCSMEYLRKRKLDPGKYACGRCRGRLELHEITPSLALDLAKTNR